MTSKPSYHHGNLKHALIEAAIDCIRQEGADNLSLRALARKVGVSQAAPYRHFADKQALLEEIVEDGFRILSTEMQSAMAQYADEPQQALLIGGQTYVQFAQAHPERYRLMYLLKNQDSGSESAAVPEQMSGCRYDAYALLETTLDKGIEHGQFKVHDRDATLLSIWSMVHGFANLVIDGTIETCEDLTGQHSAGYQFTQLLQVLFSGIVPAESV